MDMHLGKLSSSKYKFSDLSLKSFSKKKVLGFYSKMFLIRETENLIANAKDKLEKKELDMIVANIANHTNDVGFESNYNKVTVITAESIDDIDSGRKLDVALEILKRIKHCYFQAITNNAGYAEKN